MLSLFVWEVCSAPFNVLNTHVSPIGQVWTSGAYDTSISMWRWASTGVIVDYAPWGNGQPVSQEDNDRIAVYNTVFSSDWRSVDSAGQRFYICEV